MSAFKVIVAGSTMEAEALREAIEFDQRTKIVVAGEALMGLPVERFVIMPEALSRDEDCRWFDEVARLRLRPGCLENVVFL